MLELADRVEGRWWSNSSAAQGERDGSEGKCRGRTRGLMVGNTGPKWASAGTFLAGESERLWATGHAGEPGVVALSGSRTVHFAHRKIKLGRVTGEEYEVSTLKQA